MRSALCGRCGKPVDPATGYCPHCDPEHFYEARQTREPNARTPVSYQDPLSGPEPAANPYGQAAQPAVPAKKDNKNTLIGVLVALAALLAAAVAVMLLNTWGVLDIPFLKGKEPAGVEISTAAPETTAQPETTAAPTTEIPMSVIPAAAPSVPAVTAAPAVDGQQYPLENPMRLRAGPGTGYGYSKVIPVGAVVTVVSAAGDWLNVAFEGETGWIYAPSAFQSWWNGGSADEEPTADPAAVYPYNAVIKSSMKLREGPSTEFGAKTVVPSDSVVTVYEKQENPAGELWARIAYNGVEGWVRVKEAGI